MGNLSSTSQAGTEVRNHYSVKYLNWDSAAFWFLRVLCFASYDRSISSHQVNEERQATQGSLIPCQNSGFSTSSSISLDEISKPFWVITVLSKELGKNEIREFFSGFRSLDKLDLEHSFVSAHFENGTPLDAYLY